MDAPEDRDVYLHRVSSSFIAELKDSLPKFLYKSAGDPTSARIRGSVRHLTMTQLIRALEIFQETPQLLDPHLAVLLPPLVKAFLESLGRDAGRYFRCRKGMASFLVPLPRAVCMLLYTFCKVRGPKVISQFFDNEAKNLEPMLDAFQLWSQPPNVYQATSESTYSAISWQEKYIILLWLSHLLLTPFDLSTIGSVGTLEDEILPQSIELPSDLPEIATKLIAISLKNLASAGKEREASGRLLIRLGLRPDMQRLGLHDTLIRWALDALLSESSDSSSQSIYAHIGKLSFIAGIINSADATTIEPYLLHIFNCVQNLNAGDTQHTKDIASSALARKIMIKVLRSISLAAIHLASNEQSDAIGYVLEPTIELLLTALADKDTPVRYAASKALGMITVKLDPEMAVDIAEAVVGGLEENMLWENVDSLIEVVNSVENKKHTTKERNLAAVDPLRWQGLTLTLSHLLFRRSPPPSQLPQILNSLLLALDFEQRSSSGTSVGTNVRDAACFGIWSLARRYTTSELLAVDTTSVRAARVGGHSVSIIQVLATELVITATIDPSGNIRRGSSAALQELIGRHPDTILEGISLVQIVDYHAVARRSRALKEVAINAGCLDDMYWEAILNELLKWRGIFSSDADSRRAAAEAVGLLAKTKGEDGVIIVGTRLLRSLSQLKRRDVEKRHGLMLASNALMRAAEELTKTTQLITTLIKFWGVFKPGFLLAEKDFTSSILRPELTAEAACSLISSLSSTIPKAILLEDETFLPTIAACTKYINISLARREDNVIKSASQASRDFIEVLDDEARRSLVGYWIAKSTALSKAPERGAGSLGYLAALGAIYSKYKEEPDFQNEILHIILACLKGGSSVETRIAGLQALNEGIIPTGTINSEIATILSKCLQDYTLDRRGDIGSLVRLEAITTLSTAWKCTPLSTLPEIKDVLSGLCVLIAEKPDKVRLQAWTCIQDLWLLTGLEKTENKFHDTNQCSSTAYFIQILTLFSIPHLRMSILQGLVTSIAAGSESVLKASRSALSSYLESLDRNDLVVFCQIIETLLSTNLANERLIQPILETLAFVFETNTLSRLPPESFSWNKTFLLLQRSHYKTTLVSKALAAIEAYAGFAGVSDSLRPAILKKLVGLLAHPFPKIRNAAADALYILTQQPILATVDWGKAPKDKEDMVGNIRRSLGIES